MNGYRLVADKLEAADMIGKLVSNERNYDDLVSWIKNNMSMKKGAVS